MTPELPPAVHGYTFVAMVAMVASRPGWRQDSGEPASASAPRH
ncbi:hypothetical protein [Phycicoccus sp. Soil802]|nr:hypothetical protein [Phycicoccus sp. Soil802]